MSRRVDGCGGKLQGQSSTECREDTEFREKAQGEWTS
jgi:hypothetical protein